jgi:hypothetical protein
MTVFCVLTSFRFLGKYQRFGETYPFARGLFMALMMEAVRISETSVYFNETIRRCSPEDSKLHTRHHENLKSHIVSQSSTLQPET